MTAPRSVCRNTKKALAERGPPIHDEKKSVMLRGAAPQRSQLYSITACSGAADCARSAALVEPIMIASGIEPRMNIITS